MYRVKYLDPVSSEGTALWTEEYRQTQELEQADVVLVRSAPMAELAIPEGLLAVARAGTGVNNIPLDRCAERGIVVFNTPGANANGVMELTLCGMLLGMRDVIAGVEWVRSIRESEQIARIVEKGKSWFAGRELAGKRLGIIGLGAIGGPLANAARHLGMEVWGCDPYISIDGAWHLDRHVHRVESGEEIYESCDIISLHVPLLPDTERMVDASAIAKMKEGVVMVNFARGALVDEDAMERALRSGKVHRYVTDFPTPKTANMPGCITIPHLGAATAESEDNCARMAVRQVRDYLENGNITNSVNFPDCDMGICTAGSRVAILHRNIPNSLGQFTAGVARACVNIAGMQNVSRGSYAYTLLDMDQKLPAGLVEDLKKISGVLRVRIIK